MWSTRHLSTLARNGRSSSYVDRSPKLCAGSGDAPASVGLEDCGEWVLIPVCRACGREAGLNNYGGMAKHPAVRRAA